MYFLVTMYALPWIVAFILALWIARSFSETQRGKNLATLFVIGTPIAIVCLLNLGRFISETNHVQEARSIYRELESKSGEFIYKTAENVDGFLFIPKGGNRDVQKFLAGNRSDTYMYRSPNYISFDNSPDPGPYQYIDADGPDDDYRKKKIHRYRYTGWWKGGRYTDSRDASVGRRNQYKFTIERNIAIGNPVPRYSVADDSDHSTYSVYCIARFSRKITDLETNEVMAEWIRYYFDETQECHRISKIGWYEKSSRKISFGDLTKVLKPTPQKH